MTPSIWDGDVGALFLLLQVFPLRGLGWVKVREACNTTSHRFCQKPQRYLLPEAKLPVVCKWDHVKIPKRLKTGVCAVDIQVIQ